MTDADLVSVVVPVGRVDGDLRDQLDALVGQVTDRPFEVVLARNTADPVAAVALEALVARVADARIRIVDVSERRGASHARNGGAAAAKGDILAFCDADDIVEPGWLDALVEGLDGHDAVSGHFVDFGLTEAQTRARPPTTPGRLPTFLGVPYLLSSSMAVSRTVFDDVGGFDEDLVRCEDIAISWALIGKGRDLGYVSDAVLRYRHRPGLRPMVQQHFHYGRGMAQVLARYGIPDVDGEGFEQPSGLGLLRPNGQPGAKRSISSVLRRGALGAGRVTGLVEERVRERRAT